MYFRYGNVKVSQTSRMTFAFTNRLGFTTLTDFPILRSPERPLNGLLRTSSERVVCSPPDVHRNIQRPFRTFRELSL